MSSSFFAKRQYRNRGIALVLTLAFLALLCVFILAFFMNVQTNTQASHSYVSGVTVKQLADTATNIVMGQINDATRGYEVPGHPGAGGIDVQGSGKRLAWVSQPGLIRTYDDTGVPGRSFKLYSSSNMVTPPGNDFDANAALASEVPADWASAPAVFTDLNRPVMVSQTDPTSGQITSTANYPILDPGAKGVVEGFDITNAPGAAAGNAAPMPVRWVYVLADGSLASPSGGALVATFPAGVGNAVPTKENPIVGRLAFWTDDETCKLNINTASEGVFWDRPWAEGPNERLMAKSIPTQNEFNRYSGHPAMTSLSPVFGSLFPVAVAGGDPTTLELQPYLGLGAARPGTGLSPRVNIATDFNTTNKFVNVKTERLYASVDELFFTPAVSNGQRTPYKSPGPNSKSLNRDFLEQAKFFLTANSRAPELTLAGQPRIGLWPIQNSPTARNAKDRLIAFCTTTSPATKNANPYFFQRLSVYTGDSANVFTSDTPSSQDPNADWGILRNQQLFAYLQNQTAMNIPGFGGNFLTKWGRPDRDQVLTESMDYLRSSLNSYNEALAPTYEYLPSRASFPKPGETQCVPMTAKGTATVALAEDHMGFGRFASFSEAAIVFFVANDSQGDTDATKDRLQAYVLLEPFNVSPGPPVWSPNVRIIIRGLDQFNINGTSLGFRSSPQSLVKSRVGYSGGGHGTAFMGLQAMLRTYNDDHTDKNKIPKPGTDTDYYDEDLNYPFVSQEIAMPPDNAPIDFSGGNITVEIYSGYEAKANWDKTNTTRRPIDQPQPTELVQTIHMSFPEMKNLPRPIKDSGFITLDSRLNNGVDVGNLVRPNDTVRSVEATAAGAALGDLRMQAALKNVPEQYFAPHPAYQTSSRMAHSLRTSNSAVVFLTNSTTHQLETRMVKSLPYNLAYEPAAARGVNGAVMQNGLSGDWDNGPGDIEDGAYINKADEGNVATDNGDDGGYFNRGGFAVETGTTFSPNRQISSAVNFGSLPVGVMRTRDAQLSGIGVGLPWQTLLFCRNPAAGDSHPGRAVWPRDHLYLDLFTMPAVEPYAISEPFSTAGKVNLNYQIVPFTYITRSTALRGVLKSVKVMAIPASAAATYKTEGTSGDFRRSINLDETIRGFEERFATPVVATNWKGDAGVFRSASEICDMYLVPQNKTTEPPAKLETMANWWKSFSLTGDNAREIPYGQIYPRVTTRSNTFTIHMRVQVLQKSANTASDAWDESRDTVLGEYRGSSTVERYVDAGDANIPDFTSVPDATMDSYYRLRIIGAKKFAP